MQSIRTHLRVWLTIVILTMIIDGTSSLRWRNCSDSSLQSANAKCAFLTVPLDYKKPGGNTLRIALSRIAHTSSEADYQGVLLVKRGSVFVAGLTNLLHLQSKLPASVVGTYDLISFDPRGLGLTGPYLSCVPDIYPAAPVSTTPYNQRLENYWLNRSEEYVNACRRKYHSVLPHINTLNIVRDIEQIRKAINADKLHFYASAYGSYISQLYATLHSDKVGRMVLDTPADSKRLWYQRTLDLSIGMQRSLSIYYEWVAQYDSVYHLGNRSCEVEGHINKVMEELAGTTIEGGVGQTEFINYLKIVVGNAVYWPGTTSVIAAYINDGNASSLVASAGGGDDFVIATPLTISCNDRPWPKQWDTVRKDFWRIYPKASLLTWSDNWFSIPCIFWPYRNNPFVPVKGSRIGPILLSTETLAAGYREESIMDIRRTFPQARLITVVNGVASSNALSGNTCVDNTIVAYLRDGTVPARQAGDVADVECAKPPFPDPTASSKSSNSQAQLQDWVGGRFGDI